MNGEKLTICFFGEAKPEDIHTVKWAKYFSDKGHNVYLFSYSPFGENKEEKIILHLLKKKFPIKAWPLNSLINFPFILTKVRNLIRELKPDIVHAHCVTSYGTLAAMTGFHPLIITAFGSDILVNPQKSITTKWITQYALKRADLITCDAEHIKRAMIRLGEDSSKIKIIYFGVDTQKFSPGSKDEEIKRQLGISDEKIVISLRGLEPIYNVETLIKSIPIVVKEVPETKFVIAGKGSEEEILRDLAKSLGVLDSIRFIGWVSPEKLPQYLRTADIYVSTSLSDGGIAASTAEAMACGLPVVITDIGNNKDWVASRRDGFIIPVKNHAVLAEKIIYLLRNEGERLKFGENARKVIEERNNYYKEMKKMEEIYKSLI